MLKKRRILLFLFMAITCFADQQMPEQDIIPGLEWESQALDKDDFKKEKIMISLGYNCAPARHFQRHKLSEARFQLDWCFTPFEALYCALCNDFNGFLLPENMSILDSNETYHEVLDAKYNIKFVHDFKNYDQNYENSSVAIRDYGHNKEKYDRRIKRFYKALSIGKEVYFFRAATKKAEAIVLRDLISKKFPQLTYTLVALNNTPDYKKPWNEPHIKSFFLEDPECASLTDEMNTRWDVILKALKLID